jgi:hypothetical protein
MRIKLLGPSWDRLVENGYSRGKIVKAENRATYKEYYFLENTGLVATKVPGSEWYAEVVQDPKLEWE